MQGTMEGKLRELEDKMELRMRMYMMTGGSKVDSVGSGGGLLEVKHLVPEEFDGKEENWKWWKEKVLRYVGVKAPAVKRRMEEV